MADILTDADLINTLRLIRDKAPAGAAKALGINGGSLRERRRLAHARGLTADTPIVDPIEKLKHQLRVTQEELQVIRKDNLTAASLREAIYGLQAVTLEPPKWVIAPSSKATTGVPMVFWSDWHYGEVVEPAQVGGLNAYDPEIAGQRVRRLADITVDLAKGHMVNPKYPGIVVILGGDLISGDIHEELTTTNQLTVQQQIKEVTELLIAGLSSMADNFGKVFVPCVVGNHGRSTRKPPMKNRVFTNFDWTVYCQVERYFRGDKRFAFLIPEDIDARFTVQGHRFLLTHGDALGVKGGDGIIGMIGPIARGTMKVGRSESVIGRDFDTLLMGHWHTYLPRGDMVPVIVNGSPKGLDEYLHIQLRGAYARPSQALWFVHPRHGITAQWQIFLDKRQGATVPEYQGCVFGEKVDG